MKIKNIIILFAVGMLAASCNEDSFLDKINDCCSIQIGQSLLFTDNSTARFSCIYSSLHNWGNLSFCHNQLFF